MAWNILKKAFGKKNTDAKAEGTNEVVVKAAKKGKKGELTEAQLEEELKKLPGPIRKQLDNPAVKSKIVQLAKKMVADGVDIQSMKQVKTWMKKNPDATKEEGVAKVETFKHDKAKVGRNDPCPCGSGKKHKKCCG
jgi:uncharacterized protein YecA (UPF0149 family)